MLVIVHVVVLAGDGGAGAAAGRGRQELHQNFTAAVAAIGAEAVSGAEIDGKQAVFEIVGAGGAGAKFGAELLVGGEVGRVARFRVGGSGSLHGLGAKGVFDVGLALVFGGGDVVGGRGIVALVAGGEEQAAGQGSQEQGAGGERAHGLGMVKVGVVFCGLWRLESDAGWGFKPVVKSFC